MMSWQEKLKQTIFEQLDFPIHGLFFLDGDIVALTLRGAHTEGYKYPMIAFPSGEEFPLFDGGSREESNIHLFGEMDLLLYTTRDEAYLQAKDIADMCGYVVRLRGDTQMDVWGEDVHERFTLTYDNSEPVVVDIARLAEPVEPPVHQAHILMNDEIQAQLPPLFSNEHLGLEAIAPIKYFLPGTHWTWYPTEFDGNDLFFGLVAGNEVEIGSFSLSELQTLHGGLLLQVERDLYYEPNTIRELQKMHHPN